MNHTSEMPFWDHIEELRWRIFKCILAVCMGAIITYTYSDEVLLTLIEPSKTSPLLLNLQVLKVTSMFMVQLGLVIMGGIILGLPIIMYQTWAFISPAIQETYSLSVILVVTLARFFAEQIKKHQWFGYLGLFVILIIALQLIIGGMNDLNIIQINEEFKRFF